MHKQREDVLKRLQERAKDRDEKYVQYDSRNPYLQYKGSFPIKRLPYKD